MHQGDSETILKKNPEALLIHPNFQLHNFERILDMLRTKRYKGSTEKNYHQIWAQINEFLIGLNRMPESWEDRLVIYIMSLVQIGRASQTISSYIRAIKAVLRTEQIIIKDESYTLASLIKACKIKNEILHVRPPIQKGLLRILLDRMDEYFCARSQDYLCKLYKAIATTMYYGMLRMDEATSGDHLINVRDVFVGRVKDKVLLVLCSIKTHDLSDQPQQVKILAGDIDEKDRNARYCSFRASREY